MKDFITKEKIKQYLAKHPLFDFSGIQIFVYQNNVVLTGTVSTTQEKQFAESAVKQMQGINKVVSKIELISEAVTLKLPPLSSVLQF